MKKVFVLILFSFLPLIGFAQIVIEERVEVNPIPNVASKPLAQHTIHVDLQWTPAEIATFMSVSGDPNQYPCQNFGNSGWQTTGFISYEQEDLTGGIYTLRVSINAPCSPPNTITAQYSIYFDGTLLTNDTFELSGCFHAGSFPFVDLNFETPLITDYSFNIYPASLCLGKGTTPGFTLGHGCTNIEIDTTTEMVNLQILSGGEFTSFYGYQGMITDNLTVPYSALNSVELKQDQFFSGSQTTVLVQSNIGGLIKQDSIIAYPKSSYGINPSTVPYPIQYGDTKYIEVTTYGPGGCSAIFPSDIKLNAVITKGNESGYLQDFDHGTIGDTLTNITFSDFGGNHIGFISEGVKKDIADTVIVTFSTTDAEIGTKQVEVIINPSPLYVAIEPENVAPGDTALIIIKSRLEDGTLINFPEWQTFEVKMIEGCALGKILAGEDTARYFYDVPQPIKFVADSLAGGTVKLIVGLVEEIIGTRPVRESDIDKIEEAAIEKLNKLNAEKTKKEINENPPLNPGAEFCPIEEIQSFTTTQFGFLVGDECHEEIEYAISKEPQKLSPDASEIIKLRSDNYWIWTDKNGDPQITQIGDVIENHPIGAGVTKFLEKIVKNSEVEWNFGDDLVINPLLDTIALNPEEYRWIFNISNLRIPTLCDYSRFLLTPFPDLGDGTDTTLLATYITNYSLYEECLHDLDILIDGVYSHKYETLYFSFPPGMLLHEEHHFLMKKRFVPKKLNTFTFPIIRNLNAKKSEYPCPESTISKNEFIILHLNTGIKFGGDLKYAKDEEIDLTGYTVVRMKKGDGYVDEIVENFELAADKHASEFYETVLGRIIEWWKNR